MFRYSLAWILVLVLCLGAFDDAEAKKKKRRRRYSGPPPTHPMVLWSRTLSESADREQRKIAAFKLSQYSLPIFQSAVIDSVIKCMRDTDVEIKVLCAKAMAKAGTASNAEAMRKAMLERFKADPELRETLARAFIVRKDDSSEVQEALLETLKKSSNTEETLTYLSYFEQFGSSRSRFAEVLAELYKKSDNTRISRAVVKTLAEKGEGQDAIVEILVQCAESRDTPLALNCLSGLQQQGKKDSRTWLAAEKAIASTDPDVLLATLDVINAMPENANPKIAARLVEILEDLDDEDIREKAALALGVCGDHSEAVVNTLFKLVVEPGTDDSTRIAAVLVLGKQAVTLPERTEEVLSKCVSSGRSQSLRTACDLATRELEARKKLSAKSAPTPEGEKKN